MRSASASSDSARLRPISRSSACTRFFSESTSSKSESTRATSSRVVAGDAEAVAQLLQRRQAVADVLVGAAAGQRLDAPQSGADALFADDDELADVAGSVDVRAAAELGAVAVAVFRHLDDAHLGGVLLVEQRRRAAGRRFFVGLCAASAPAGSRGSSR